MAKLPKNPKKGQTATILVGKGKKKRKVTFVGTGKTGCGMWKITKNEKA